MTAASRALAMPAVALLAVLALAGCDYTPAPLPAGTTATTTTASTEPPPNQPVGVGNGTESWCDQFGNRLYGKTNTNKALAAVAKDSTCPQPRGSR